MSAMHIGTFRVDAVSDGEIVQDPARQYAAIPPEKWAVHQDVLDADGQVLNSVGGYLVRDGQHIVLVDAGVGRTPMPPFRAGDLLTSLASLGIAPDAVTHVLFTHLHFDHIGWASENGAAVFPNACYVAHRADWDYFYREDYQALSVEADDDRPIRRLAPVAGEFDLRESDGEVLPGLVMRHTGGHTPGSVIYELSSEGERGLLVGDVAHNPVELLEADWVGVADVDPERARRNAMELAAELERTQTPFAAAHFPGFAWARLHRVDGRLRWAPLPG